MEVKEGGECWLKGGIFSGTKCSIYICKKLKVEGGVAQRGHISETYGAVLCLASFVPRLFLPRAERGNEPGDESILCPDPTLSQEKGCGDFLGCAVNSEEANATPSKLASEIGLHQKYVIIDC